MLELLKELNALVKEINLLKEGRKVVIRDFINIDAILRQGMN